MSRVLESSAAVVCSCSPRMRSPSAARWFSSSPVCASSCWTCAGERVAFLAHRAQPVELVLELLVRGLQAAVGEPEPGELVGLGARDVGLRAQRLELGGRLGPHGRELRGEPLGLRPCRLELGLRRGERLRVGGEQLDLAPGLRDLGPQRGQLRGLVGRRQALAGLRPHALQLRAGLDQRGGVRAQRLDLARQPLGVGAGAVGVRAQRFELAREPLDLGPRGGEQRRVRALVAQRLELGPRGGELGVDVRLLVELQAQRVPLRLAARPAPRAGRSPP